MPQVFKSRRNILRAANKSKREHFTENDNQDSQPISYLKEENPVLVEDLNFNFNVKKRYDRKVWIDLVNGNKIEKEETIGTSDLLNEKVVDGSIIRGTNEVPRGILPRGTSLEKEKIPFEQTTDYYGLTSLTINSDGNVITLKHGETEESACFRMQSLESACPRMQYWILNGFQLSSVFQVVTYENDDVVPNNLSRQYAKTWFDLELDNPDSLKGWEQQSFTASWNSREYTLDKWEWTLDVPVPVQNVFFYALGTLKFNMSGNYTGYLVEYFDTAGNIIGEPKSDVVTPSDSSTIEIKITNGIPLSASMAKIAAVNGPVASKAIKAVRTILPNISTPSFEKQWGSLIGTGSEGIQTCEQLNNARNLLELGSAPYCGESFQQEPKEFPNSKKKKDEDF